MGSLGTTPFKRKMHAVCGSSNQRSKVLTRNSTVPLINEEIDGAHIYGVRNLVEKTFPDSVFPFCISDAMDAMNRLVGGCSSLKQVSWRDMTPPNAEDARLWCDFLNNIAKLVVDWHTKKYPDSSPLFPHLWSNVFCNKPAGSTKQAKDESCQRQPDTFLYNPAILPNPENALRSHVISSMELKFGKNGRQAEFDDVVKQLFENARLQFGAQDDRRFFLGLTILEQTKVSFHYFDRSGMLSTLPIDIQEDPEAFLRIACGFAFADMSTLGFDPNIFWEDNVRLLKAFGERFAILKVLHCNAVIRGRGTICYRVKHLLSGQIFTYKSSWGDVERNEKERELLQDADDIEFLSHLAKLQFSDVDGVLVNRPAFGPAGIDGAVDSTATIRTGLDVFSDKNRALLLKVGHREHTCLLLREYGVGLEEFSSRHEFSTILIDIIRGIYTKTSPNGVHQGMLIDFDYSIATPRTEPNLTGHRTGTLPYISVHILINNPPPPHLPCHDLESIFYVMIWTSIMLLGPKKWLGVRVDSTPLWVWISESNLKKCGMAKILQMCEDLYVFPEVLAAFHPYFDFLKDAICKLRPMFFSKAVPDVTYQQVLDILLQLRDTPTRGHPAPDRRLC